MWYQFLNIFFFVFHSLFTLFNLIGWIFPATRKWHLLTILLTAFSWFVMGIWYGWGYCVCTDWHWNVREKLGLDNPTHSYINFLLYKFTGIQLRPSLVETVTLIVFLVCCALSIYLNARDWKKRVTNR